MRVVEFEEVQEASRHVAVGVFDGVHIGHQAVIAGADTVLSFDPHPLQVLHRERAPQLLTELRTKAQCLRALGVGTLAIIPFDARWASLPPEGFIDEVLVERLGARAVRVGANFRFGVRASGSTDMLRRDSRFETTVVGLVRAHGDIVSSTRIRELVATGDVARAAALLGRSHRLLLTRARESARGLALYSKPNEQLAPAVGHYRATVTSRGSPWPGRVCVSDDGVAVHAPPLGDRPPAELAVDFHAPLAVHEPGTQDQ